MLQREIIKNFVAIKRRDNKAKLSGQYKYYQSKINKQSFANARFSIRRSGNEGEESDDLQDYESDLENDGAEIDQC